MEVSVTKNDHYKEIQEIHEIIKRGGPDVSEFEFLARATLKLRNISLKEQNELRNILNPLFDNNSMIGFTFNKPHGYAGDFELIHRIYTFWKSSNIKNKKWDELYHWAESANAVRNRKRYLIDILRRIENGTKSVHRVLNLGSGPCTDLYEYFINTPKSAIKFDCVDMDENSIEFAKGVCDNFIDSINFENKNVFHFKSNYNYELIWSAGLFDYFNDKLFIRLVRRYYEFLAPGGELVIGNFSLNNPSRGLMEVLCQWYLHHRSEEQLIELALKAGIDRNRIEVRSELTKINLFLHIYK